MKKNEDVCSHFLKLLEIMDRLRNECPWDKKQTIDSLRKLTIEELYELVDTIDTRNFEAMKGELGDLLLHIVFYSKIASEQDAFSIEDVIKNLNQKLIERHPHIFLDVTVNNDNDVKRNWEAIKLNSGKNRVLDGVPNSLPAVVKAYRIQEKVRSVGFDWEKREQVWDKVNEELQELINATNSNDADAMEKELGDLLFSIINAARLYDIDPEKALELSNKKFIKRFNYLEERTIKQGRSLNDMTLDEMNEIWEEAKQFDN